MKKTSADNCHVSFENQLAVLRDARNLYTFLLEICLRYRIEMQSICWYPTLKGTVASSYWLEAFGKHENVFIFFSAAEERLKLRI